MKINCIINKNEISAEVNERTRLIDFLRDDLHLTGTKEGCSEGECGACTVIVNGKAITSCTMLASQVDGCEVITIEGLKQNGEFDILQKNFVEHDAVQCGFCSPGFIMSAKALMMNNPNPTLEDIKRSIEGNLCRCTGYIKIIEAIEDAVKEVNK
ncbi:carbon-monoxide dehydrogenase small subunit [Peptoniphilus asaccharolyticus DSM 20463]|uniref:Carbon-monoxide dehydrogenase small subunit n=1 Tax=Peptoniphilus asaccharolyticus DSM 20463 TaxID=573058 RepID=A0A1W1V3Z6_PEPAS|nr:(2Fe-2S)-binding protein [Peptoniphilus asaccharolyticus]MBL7576268.1 (2Fe-2S)-binding protein [Peptoniphilus asaccharolyticus]SMB88052.1 carbon-monoxide dehydrogenase small subunit [Peptoniphilus asaccharolyticus DSM 20463]